MQEALFLPKLMDLRRQEAREATLNKLRLGLDKEIKLIASQTYGY